MRPETHWVNIWSEYQMLFVWDVHNTLRCAACSFICFIQLAWLMRHHFWFTHWIIRDLFDLLYRLFLNTVLSSYQNFAFFVGLHLWVLVYLIHACAELVSVTFANHITTTRTLICYRASSYWIAIVSLRPLLTFFQSIIFQLQLCFLFLHCF